jgi:hypothetical protein
MAGKEAVLGARSMTPMGREKELVGFFSGKPELRRSRSLSMAILGHLAPGRCAQAIYH